MAVVRWAGLIDQARKWSRTLRNPSSRYIESRGSGGASAEVELKCAKVT